MSVSQAQQRMKMSYKSNRHLLNKIDNLPTHGPPWICDIVNSPGDRPDEDGTQMDAEELELWRRDPVECVRELIGNPAFADSMEYAPERIYTDKAKTNRVINETWTADWWWETQVRVLSITVSVNDRHQ
jgi:Plavaka transposase